MNCFRGHIGFVFHICLTFLLFASTSFADPAEPTWCRDADGDGFGSPWDSVESATQPPGYISDCTDCDDRYDFIYPGAPEICDGFDNDCDGTVDQLWPLVGSPCSVGFGACEVAGTMVCNQNGDGIECDAQPGEPFTEICDGIDNDCDGIVDQHWPDLGYPCLVGAGECEAHGMMVCDPLNSSVTVCSATPFPTGPEICDCLDNDCDGIIDNNCASGIHDSLRARGFELDDNMPNPFNPRTTIRFFLPVDDQVHVTIHDVAGKLVRRIIDGKSMAAGYHEVIWDGEDQNGRSVASGVYFYSLKVGEHQDVKRMALIR